MLDVKFYEVFQEEGDALRKFLPCELSVDFEKLTIHEAGEKAPPAALISTRTQSHIPLSWSREIKGILTRSQGYDHLVKYCREIKTKLPCGYLSCYAGQAVAQQAIMLMLMLMRKAGRQTKNFEQFSRDDITGVECKNKNALVVGVGNIGVEIVNMARGLGMNVWGVDIVQKLIDLNYVPIEQGVPWADVIFCALSLTDETNQMLNYQSLQSSRKGFFLVNIARGEITPMADLKKLLDEDKLRGIGMDVFEDEGNLVLDLRKARRANHPISQLVVELIKRDNVIFTPHNAFNTKEALDKKVRLSVDAVTAFLKTGEFPSQVPGE